MKPKITGVDDSKLNLAVPKKVIEGKDWFLEGDSNNRMALAIMGNVAYPIEASSIPNLPAGLKVIANNPFIITFPLGALEFAASRESLSYTEFTCKKLIDRLEEVRAELADSFHKKVFAASKNHLNLYHAFAKTYAEFKKVMNVSSYDGDIDNIFTQLLLSKDQDDNIEFQGSHFEVSNLINCTYNVTRDLYQSYGMYSHGQRGRSHRFFLEPSTKLKFVIKKTCDSTTFFPTTYNHTLEEGEIVIFNHDWRANVVANRRSKNLNTMDLVLLNLDSLNVTSRNAFKIETNYKEFAFVINDAGSTGRDRFKSLVTNHRELANSKLTDLQMVFIDFNPKVNTLDEVTNDLKNVISKTLTGATIKLISNLPDVRATIAKVKIAKESLKLRIFTFGYHNPVEHAVGQNYFEDSNVTITADKLYASREEDAIVTLASLLARKQVFFVIKRRVRSKLFDNVGSTRASCHSNQTLMNLSSTLGFFDDAVVMEDYNENVRDNATNTVINVVKQRKILPLIIINEAQHVHLVKKGVNLISITTLISEKILKLEEMEKFTEVIGRVMTLSNVHHLRGMYENMIHKRRNQIPLTDSWKDSKNFYKVLFTEYRDLRTNSKKYANNFAKLEVLDAICLSTKMNYDAKSNEINEQISERYPMLPYIDYNSYDNGEKLLTIIAYIDQTDSLIAQAFKESAKEVEVEVEI